MADVWLKGHLSTEPLVSGLASSVLYRFTDVAFPYSALTSL